jgi:cytochrome c peroxidase
MFDGRETSLEAQALFPLFAANEMDMTGSEIEARLAADTAYIRRFRHAYGEGPITLEGVIKALATYQRTLVSHRAPYDRWVAGEDGALSSEAKRGAVLFLGAKTDCRQCHVPPLFTDEGFHNTGLDSAPQDLGRAAVTGRASDAGRFKTPTLRNIELTGPYMHDGRFQTLGEVLQHYNAGGGPHANKDPRIRPLGLTPGELADLAAFLESLTDLSFLESPWP